MASSILHRSFCFLIGLLLLIPVEVFAQGNDFPPFVPNFPPQWFYPVPPYNQGYNYNWGTVWGAYTLWEAKKGDTVEFAINMNWWPGPIYLSPISEGASNMRWVGGEVWDHGQLGYWCTYCIFRFEAGQDYPNLQLDFYGPYRWGETHGGYLQVTQVIPAPPVAPSSIFTPEQKENARYWRDITGYATTFIGSAAAGYCIIVQDRICAGLGAGAFIAGVINNHFATIVVDPWDPDWTSTIVPAERDAAYYGFSYTGDWDHDMLIYDATVIADWTEAANVAINRANTALALGSSDWASWHESYLHYFQQVVGSFAQDAANHLYNLRVEAESQGSYNEAEALQIGLEALWYAGSYLQQQ